MLRSLFLCLAMLMVTTVAHAGETVSAWVDLRAVSGSDEAGWRDGGYGKLRYGGERRFEAAQVAVLWTPRLSDNITAHVMMQAVPDGSHAGGISEAYVQWKPVPRSAVRVSFRLGQMFPPLSLEHDGPGWTTTRTLTPSAINSWIGEEVLVDGLEARIQTSLHDHILAVTAGIFAGDDTAGTVLALRGWAQHDVASTSDSKLPLPDTYNGLGYVAVFTRQARFSRPAVEVDGRAGQYLRLDWRPPAPVVLNLFYFNNPGNPAIVKHGQYGWTTHFLAAGMQWRLTGTYEVLAQALRGLTKMGAVFPDGRHPADIDFESAYILLSHSLSGGARLTGRIDTFRVRDFSPIADYDNNEHGVSATVAWLKPLTPHLDLAVEGMQVVSRRPSRSTQFEAPRQTSTQIQVALKFHL